MPDFFPVDNYETDQAPRVAYLSGKVVENEPLPVELSLEILGFDEIDTVKMMFRFGMIHLALPNNLLT